MLESRFAQGFVFVITRTTDRRPMTADKTKKTADGRPRYRIVLVSVRIVSAYFVHVVWTSSFIIWILNFEI